MNGSVHSTFYSWAITAQSAPYDALDIIDVTSVPNGGSYSQLISCSIIPS